MSCPPVHDAVQQIGGKRNFVLIVVRPFKPLGKGKLLKAFVKWQVSAS
jgi:hypothetical protein